MMAMRVYVIDDDEAVRRSVGMLLRSVHLDVKGCDSAAAFLDAWTPGVPTCLVVDVRMPGMSGLELHQVLRSRGIGVPVIFITGHGDVSMAVAAMKLGAYDFLEKPFRDQELLDRVQQALLVEDRKQRRNADLSELRLRYALLTARERDVHAGLVRGDANKVIAANLGLSERTVEVHRSRVMEKMNARSLADLVRMSLLIESDSPGA
jgi:FixJ family two-component response regulator